MQKIKYFLIGLSVTVGFLLGGWTATKDDMIAGEDGVGVGVSEPVYNIVQKWLTQATVGIVTVAGVVGVTLPNTRKEENV